MLLTDTERFTLLMFGSVGDRTRSFWEITDLFNAYILNGNPFQSL